MTKLISVVSGALLTMASLTMATAVAAEETMAQGKEAADLIAKHDKDADAKLNANEASSAGIAATAFDAADGDRNGLLDTAEVGKWLNRKEATKPQ